MEGVKYYPSFSKIKARLSKALKEERPDLVILVDSRDFNLRIARLAKKLGLLTLYYIAPPVWALNDWQTRRISRNIDRIIAIFSFEAETYRKAKANVSLVGYPLVDLVRPSMSKEETLRKFNLTAERLIVGLLPGSRKHEIKKILPLILKVAAKLTKEFKDIQFLLAEASPVFHSEITRIVSGTDLPLKIISDRPYDLMNVSDLLITASGTATLEAAFLDTPMIVIYKTSFSTWLIGQILIKLPYIALPNIIAGEEIVPELIGFRLTVKRLTSIALELLGEKEKLEKMRVRLREVTEKLGKAGAVDRTARIVVEMVNSS
ncbi:Lipid-A-disaccharide synthase [subsurface metagenome]